MIRATRQSRQKAIDRAALRRRVKLLYDQLNQGQWQKCFALIDPRLMPKVEPASYVARLTAFKKAYGRVHPWHMRISLHADGSSNKRDPRPFAYVYLIWQDDAREFHMFRERWVKDGERWFTRVVGIVPNPRESAPILA
jgi:hypothetical protein